jgi:hypothetical protein
MKSVLETTDKDAFAFLRCEVRSPGGQEAPVRWLCDVVRIIDALDEGKSAVGIGVADDGSKVYIISGRPTMVFRELVVGGCHVFRMKHYHELVVCEEDARRACKSAELTGISFHPTQ